MSVTTLTGVVSARVARLGHRERGMATAEYAITCLAAVALAAVLFQIMSSGGVKGVLDELIRGLFSKPGK